MRYLAIYLRAMWTGWAARMSSSVSLAWTGLGLWQVLSKKPAVSNITFIIFWAIGAVICAYIAGFMIWKKERINLEKERTRNATPELTGEIKEAVFEGWLSGLSYFSQGENMGDVFMTLHIYVVNVRPSCQTTLRDWHLHIEAPTGIYKAENVPMSTPLLLDRQSPEVVSLQTALNAVPEKVLDFSDVIFMHGIGISRWLRFCLKDAHDFEKNASCFVLTLVDSFGNAHEIRRRPGPWPNAGKIRMEQLRL